MNLKSILKSLKINESTISMFLGALVVIVVGVLVVNYFKDKENLNVPSTSTNNEVQIQENTHTVAVGETLWKIAEDTYGSGYNWVDIAKANNITNGNQIEAGQKLSIPDVAARQPTVKTARQTDLNANQTITDSSYTVVHGDNLWKIAVRAYGDGYKWVDIAKANNLSNPNIIHTGNVLVLPR